MAIIVWGQHNWGLAECPAAHGLRPRERGIEAWCIIVRVPNLYFGSRLGNLPGALSQHNQTTFNHTLKKWDLILVKFAFFSSNLIKILSIFQRSAFLGDGCSKDSKDKTEIKKKM